MVARTRETLRGVKGLAGKGHSDVNKHNQDGSQAQAPLTGHPEVEIVKILLNWQFMSNLKKKKSKINSWTTSHYGGDDVLNLSYKRYSEYLSKVLIGKETREKQFLSLPQ